jgi:hypothetical protein
MTKNRVPLQVHPLFREKLKELQEKMASNGQERSLRDITAELIPVINEMESKVIKNLAFKVRFDKRWH